MCLCLLMVLVALGSSKADNVLPVTAEMATPMDQCPQYDDPHHPILLPFPDDCSKYYSCIKGKAYPQQCGPNYYWSQKNYRCDFIEYSNCKLNPVEYSPFPGDCTRYYEKKVISCGYDKQWNDVTQQCVPLPNGRCADGSYPPQNPGTNTDIIPTAATPPTPPVGQSGNNIIPTAATPPTPPAGQSGNYLPIDPIAICKTNNQYTYLPYPNDCRKFILCKPQPIVVNCKGQGMYWNAQNQICDKSSAGCQWGGQ